ncbi:hypothetical protein BU26DRAFT_567324 [Trematosphaeria pertusa]|uniref:F-box domain-containing protein n=1 Tax=Trematosphaeria pertusa TaxID=390896 RepID=A0A6A6I5K2_9PLEO|nr:uncharacterized protein BU26DRAFT_567324 [Trematosphaeria pertusa]KAF2245805.1 hypothetical protein BU26DRAFT_567324 [Trematosphaeria pertusa]
MAMIFLSLPFHDLLRCQQVCHSWNDHILGEKSMQKRMWKVCVEENENPHFDEPSALARNIILEDGRNAGLPALETSQTVIDTFLEAYPTTGDLPGSDRDFLRYLHGLNDACSGAPDINDAGDWPTGWHELYCHECEEYHTKFRFENVHPLFRFLEDTPLCITGSSSRLIVKLKLVHSEFAPASCYDHYCAGIIGLAKNLEKAYHAMDKGKLKGDMFTCPWCTMLVARVATAPIERTIASRNPLGLTVQEALKLLVQLFWEELQELADSNKVTSITCLLRSAQDPRHFWNNPNIDIVGRSLSHRNEGDWERHLKTLPAILEQFERAVRDADAIMRPIPEWKGIP